MNSSIHKILISTLCIAFSGCGSGITLFVSSPGGPADPLTSDEVNSIVLQAVSSISLTTMVVAVTDREGNVLAVFRKPDASAQVRVLLNERMVTVDSNELAVALARTGAFFSNDQAPLSSRTVRFISREHFPPTFAFNGRTSGVKNTPSGALWDIENTNRGCGLSMNYLPGMEIAPAMTIDRSGPGIGIATIPGGVPLYKSGKLVGGIGVVGVAPNIAEFAAFTGSSGFGPVVAPPGEIFIDGVRLPFVNQTTRPIATGPGGVVGSYISIPDLTNLNTNITGPQGSIRANVPEGWLVGPNASAELTAVQVRSIITNAIFQANRTRAAIRLPLQVRTKMVMAVASLNGDVIGLFRMPDATVFSIDVAVTKARNVAYLSSLSRSPADLPGIPFGTAVTSRTLRFTSQPFFPPGIPDSFPGPMVPLRIRNRDMVCSQGYQAPGANQSGIVFFPGSAPLYQFGFFLSGGLGVSGDGVDQDDLVTSAGLRGYESAPFLRADRVSIDGVPLPYLKFPRAPEE